MPVIPRFARSLGVLLLALALAPWGARAAEPIKIGFSMALTGGLSPIGKSALLAMQIWESDINAKGGLLGRPVQLVYYDDQSSPSTVPGIYTKLLDVDKCELVVGPYATQQVAPAMPVIIQHKMTFIGLFALAVNTEFKYPGYFSMLPTGPNAKAQFSKGFFEIAKREGLKTVAIAAADQEFSHNAADGARENAAAAGLKIVYDKTYPSTTTDYAPIVRAVQAANPDAFMIASYPPDSVGMVRAIREVGYTPKLVGGGMVGLQATAIKTQLGPLLNGIVDYDFWQPVKTMEFPGVMDFLKVYQSKAGGAGVDPLGFYLPPYAYAYLQVLADAVEGTKSLDQAKLADYMHKNGFKTIIGDVKFGADGEWAQSRVLQVQYQHITGNDVGQFKSPEHIAILTPASYATGKLLFPYADALK